MKREMTVRYRPDNITIAYYREGREIYYTDIEEATNSARLLDLILQADRHFGPEVVGQLITEIDRVCWIFFRTAPQGVFCPFGQDQEVTWPRLTPEEFSKAEREYEEWIRPENAPYQQITMSGQVL